MGIPPARDVTRLLLAWRHGDGTALDYLLPHVYRELHAIATRYMRRDRPGSTVQTTTLVREAYLRLIDSTLANGEHRAHFLAIAARQMRRILVDVARARAGNVRGAATQVISDEALVVSREPRPDLVALDEALLALEQFDPRKARVVELRWFGGLTAEETAQALDVTPEAVEQEWNGATLWLRRHMRAGVERHEES